MTQARSALFIAGPGLSVRRSRPGGELVRE
jgi:hypothetical protein